MVMTRVSRLAPALLSLSFLLGLGCASDPGSDGGTDGTLRSDGYAVFRVDNPRDQRNDVTVRVLGAEPGVTYALLVAREEPSAKAWFALPSDEAARCLGNDDEDARCEAPGGRVVDLVTASSGDIALRHEVAAPGHGTPFQVFFSVLRLEQTGKEAPIRVEVVARRTPSGAEPPTVVQVR